MSVPGISATGVPVRRCYTLEHTAPFFSRLLAEIANQGMWRPYLKRLKAADSWRNYKSADKVMAYEGHMIQPTNLPQNAVPSKIGAIEKPLKPGHEDADD
ncbi:hypothetical protein Pmar_PMAR028761 [Perkinsus marinus ATCC 50983]|uniref:Uncharacterized protein n=1 Tax=Perkinsus marinus (strain ATCC 50983 / TXsc) TaxID=423536 RepID=C5LRM2_PERM5|nr:hypothetical protein Pmar_PMAR028761 [Perkinsus marinus ATCC 50983]EER00621.1 hypothetical protein Pmar_PMAR028761 [Perkinsus marinus ATCC 50983]|eukprot:XP_002767903.1 hypothetical protein Pmar_PMAR028761 [Perkinsus marinus ATCC 50983]